MSLFIRFFSKAHDLWGLSQFPSCQCHLFASKRFSGLFLPLEVIGIVTDVMTDVSLGPVSYQGSQQPFSRLWLGLRSVL